MNYSATSTDATLSDRILEENFGIDGGHLVIGGVDVAELADTYGTPLYVYDGEQMRRRYRELASAVRGFADVYYSVKANPNPAIASLFVNEGAGLEIASGSEFLVARQADCAPERILFAGPGKGEDELSLVLGAGIGEVHLESFEEIEACAGICQELGCEARVAIRVNPSSAAQGGAMRMGGKATGFGFDEDILAEVIARVQMHAALKLTGIHVFAGTQILDADVLLNQWSHAIAVSSAAARLIGHPLETIDLGGGLGVPYHAGDKDLDLGVLRTKAPELAALLASDPLLKNTQVILEPGRYLTASAGVYLMGVRATKISRDARFIVTDGGMHHHLGASGNLGQIVKRDYPLIPATKLNDGERSAANVIGPLCTPLDTLGRQTPFPDLQKGDLVGVLQSGAYGLTASPTGFLSHPTPVEVLIERGEHRTIRPRGTFSEPFAAPCAVDVPECGQ